MLKILVASNAGFCFGVKKAVETAQRYAAEPNCYLLGDIIHNRDVVASLEAKGLKKIDGVDSLPPLKDGETGKVIIRSHGADKATYDGIRMRGYQIIDATCPFVVKIHDIVYKHYKDGYHIVIIGGADHPEVIATAGWCDNTATVVDNDSDLTELSKYDKLCFVCQTTYDGKKFKKFLKKYIKSKQKRLKFSTRFAILLMSAKKKRWVLPKPATLCLL